MRRLARAALLVAGAAAALACHRRDAATAPATAVEDAVARDAEGEPVGEVARDAGDAARAATAVDAAAITRVFSPVSGRVVMVRVQVGDRVRRGDVLAKIEPIDVVTPTTDVAKAEADFIAAEHQLRRMKELCKSDCTRRDYEQTEDEYLRAKAELERARYRARTDRERVTVALPAPLDGIVTARAAVPGAAVRGLYEADAGATELFAIAPDEGD
jgi:multidrug resistance efflux pump